MRDTIHIDNNMAITMTTRPSPLGLHHLNRLTYKLHTPQLLTIFVHQKIPVATLNLTHTLVNRPTMSSTSTDAQILVTAQTPNVAPVILHNTKNIQVNNHYHDDNKITYLPGYTIAMLTHTPQ